MNATVPDSFPFEMSGRFGGFVFTDEGKRRMLLRLAERDCLLKAPRELRHRIIGKFRPGEPIRVAGFGERDPLTGTVKHIVSRVLPPDGALPPPTSLSPAFPAATAAVCTIRVCAKKNCWRNGGRELWGALGQEVDTRGLAGQIVLRQVGCLDRCKQAPNADLGRHELSRCSPRDAVAIIARAAENLSSRGVNS